jgi:hypothetical protein
MAFLHDAHMDRLLACLEEEHWASLRRALSPRWHGET